jgi:hypothetical protein
MSQQSDFQQPEQMNREERADNTDRREQSGMPDAQNRPPEYAAAPPLGQQKTYSVRRGRGRRWLWITILIVIVILVLVGGGGYVSNSVGSKSQALPQQTVSVAGTPNVVINNAAGVVKIHQGSGNSVGIEATAHGSLFTDLSSDRVDIKQNGDTIDIQVEQPENFIYHGSVDLDITLPANSNIQATVNAGGLDINGVSGQMDLNVKAGALNFENGTIEGNSTFVDSAGAINFDGSIAPNGNYSFKDSAGAINLTLPSTVAFTIDASSTVGKVTNDFGTNTVGSNPTSHITVHTDVGAVNIHQK